LPYAIDVKDQSLAVRRSIRFHLISSLSNPHRPRSALDSIALRTAFGSFATGVTVVTAIDEHGTPVGMTANSFGSVSLDPPLAQWSLRINSGLHRTFVLASHFSVSVLGADQEAIARQFASRAPDRFEGVALTHWDDSPPLITGALAHFVCKKINDYRVGDHELFVGEVLHAAMNSERSVHEPLLFFASKFASLASRKS
jgi:3-hydroxy-9,10-secoandrosta-1,3,5(10)-triene-9,17-dione monooxygenase reductase component